MIISAYTGKCPHCKVVNKFITVTGKLAGSPYKSELQFIKLYSGELNDNNDTLYLAKCTNCHKFILSLDDTQIFPLGSMRSQVPPEVTQNIANDFTEACLIETLSKKGSAALARRCLQAMLIEQGIKNKDLSKQIDEVIPKLPTYLGNAIDSIRVVGNFAVHAIKSTSTGEIVEVEPGEAELLLDVLEMLFDFYYVKPVEMNKKISEINLKLADSNKPPLKIV